MMKIAASTECFGHPLQLSPSRGELAAKKEGKSESCICLDCSGAVTEKHRRNLYEFGQAYDMKTVIYEEA